MEGKTFTFQGGDNNNGPAGDDTVVAKVETGGSSEQSTSNKIYGRSFSLFK